MLNRNALWLRQFSVVGLGCGLSLACAEGDNLDPSIVGNDQGGSTAQGGEGGGGSGGEGGAAGSSSQGGSGASAGQGGSGAMSTGGSGAASSGGVGATGGAGGAMGGTGGAMGGTGGAMGGSSGSGGSGGVGGGTSNACPGEAFTLELQLDATYTGQLSGDTNANTDGASADCGGLGADAVYRFTAPSDGETTVTVTSTFDAVVYVREDNCSGNDLACEDRFATQPEELTFTATAGRTYYLFIDSVSTSERGSYSADIVLDPPPMEDSCPGEIVPLMGIGSDPRTASVNGSLASSTDTQEPSCNTGDGADNVFRFEPDTTGIFNLDLTSSFDAVLSTRSSCDQSSSELSCADSGSGGETTRFWAEAGNSYFAIVDGVGSASGTFTLAANLVPEEAREKCPGETVTWSNTTFTVNGDTSLRWPDEAATCSGDTDAAPDAVFEIPIPGDGILDLSVTGALDPVISLRTSCGDSGTEVDCQATTGSDSFQLPVTTGQTYYAIVDGQGGTPAGSFTLTGTLFQVPESDECPGEPLTFVGNTATVNADLANPSVSGQYSGGCGGSNTDDLVYSFTAPSNALYSISVAPTGNWDPIVYVRFDCANPGTQLQCRNNVGAGATELLNLNASANSTYYIFVDGSFGSTGPFTLTVTR